MRDTCPSEDSNCYPEITRPSFEYTLAKRGIMRLTVRYHISFHQRYTRATIDVQQRSSSKHERDQHEDYVTATLETRDESVCVCVSFSVFLGLSSSSLTKETHLSFYVWRNPEKSRDGYIMTAFTLLGNKCILSSLTSCYTDIILLSSCSPFVLTVIDKTRHSLQGKSIIIMFETRQATKRSLLPALLLMILQRHDDERGSETCRLSCICSWEWNIFPSDCSDDMRAENAFFAKRSISEFSFVFSDDSCHAWDSLFVSWTSWSPDFSLAMNDCLRSHLFCCLVFLQSFCSIVIIHYLLFFWSFLLLLSSDSESERPKERDHLSG